MRTGDRALSGVPPLTLLARRVRTRRRWQAPRRSSILMALLTAWAVTLAGHGTALAVQAPLLTSAWVAELPAGPDSPAWGKVSATFTPLTPQTVALPRLAQASISHVMVRSLNDGQRIAMLLEWRDATRDTRATRPNEFRDGAAILVPVGTTVPFVCMGAPGQLTNLWHWKADWQEDLDHGFQEVPDAYPNFYTDTYPFVTGQAPYRWPADFGAADARLYSPGLAAGNPLAQPRVSPVEELLAIGFGTATHKPRQEVAGQGVWIDTPGNRGWRVMFVRPLAASDGESADLAGRSEVPVAFAVWNGANQEVGARKQLSSLVTMRIRGSPAAARQRWWDMMLTDLNTPPTYFFVGYGLLIAAAALAGSWVRQRAGAAPGGASPRTPSPLPPLRPPPQGGE